MSVNLQCENFILSKEKVDLLWIKVREKIEVDDSEIVIKCVSEDEIRGLNKKYRKKDKATNVLTFNYSEGEVGSGDCDVALCLSVVKKEAVEKNIDEKKYTAWVVTHALLHAAGLDHERSRGEANKMRRLEEEVLQLSGY